MQNPDENNEQAWPHGINIDDSSNKSSSKLSSQSDSNASPFDILQNSTGQNSSGEGHGALSSAQVAHQINIDCKNIVQMVRQNPSPSVLAAAQRVVQKLQDLEHAILNATPTDSSLQHSGTAATLSSSSNTRSD